MKKKGSALVFSVLILAFFLAIALNIFFIARKKAERASVKVAGEVTTNNIDIASSLGYQELLLAETFVRVGFPYADGHEVYDDPKYTSYPDITGVTYSRIYLLDNGSYNESYPGIQINNFIDFFSSQWSIGDSTNQKLVLGEDILSGEPLRRMWLSGGVENKLIPLWSPLAIGNSIGGYALITSRIPTSDAVDAAFSATYEKFIRFNEVMSGSDTLISESIFRIEVTESFVYSISSGVITSVSDREITDFIVESINP